MSNGKVEVDRVFIGAGCNRIVNNVSWGASDLVAFGAQNAVSIFCPKVLLLSPSITNFLLYTILFFLFFFSTSSYLILFIAQSAQILTTLPGHKASVNCTHWLPSNKYAFKGNNFSALHILTKFYKLFIQTVVTPRQLV